MTLREWNHRRWLMHRGVSKFKQDGSYKKKQPNHVKRDWRDRKGFAMDQSKSKMWCKCGTFLKDIDHRGRRCYERVMIQNDRWDEMTNHKDQFVSSWDAC